MAALRAGAGLVTVASAQSAIPVIASYAPELMTEALTETECGAISSRTLVAINGKDVVALGPGLGTHPETVEVVRRLVAEVAALLVIDADGLNALAGLPIQGRNLILTPHPGEMARLVGLRPAQVQADRMGIARAFATEHGLTLVLKGQRTLIAFADGRVWINPTGSPAMAKGGSGDILTGLIAGLLAQTPQEPEAAIAAAVYLHGRAGELGAAALGERSLIATDLLKFLPEAMHECAGSPDQH
jgi:NAD(P)H-hydrate epimerase